MYKASLIGTARILVRKDAPTWTLSTSQAISKWA